MTSPSSPSHPSLHRSRRSPLIRNASLLSLVGILTSGAVYAQTTGSAASSLEPVPAETAPEPPAAAIEPPAAPVEAPAAPAVPPAAEAKPDSNPALDSAEVYIDSTRYDLGATQRTSEVARDPIVNPSGPVVPQAIAAPELSSVPLAPEFALPEAISSPGRTIPVGIDYMTVKQFYSRTLRPPGRLGNGNIRLVFPLSIPAPITSLFGWRIHPVTGDSRFHSGTDLGAPLGTPVLAAYAGQVAIADFLGGYGLAVTLKHNSAQETLYAHLSEIFVKPGEWVKQGQAIGRVGSTGLSTGPHLHFEFRQLTPDGWVALDAGSQLEYALAELVKGVQVAQAPAAAEPTVKLSQTKPPNLPRLPNYQLSGN